LINVGGLLIAARLIDMAENVLAASRSELNPKHRFDLLASAFRTGIRVKRIIADTNAAPLDEKSTIFDKIGITPRATQVISESHAHLLALGWIERLHADSDKEMRADIDELTRRRVGCKGNSVDV
jgi:sugar-specific transcriptional regulator TrmB